MRQKRVAPLWKRILAYIIDGFFVSGIVLLPLKDTLPTIEATSFREVMKTLIANTQELWSRYLITTLVVAVITVMYWAILEYKLHQSIGKWIMRLEVTTENKKLTLKQCVIRNLSKISGLLLFIDVLYMFFKKGNQRYLEIVSQTYVMEKEPSEK